MTIEYRKILFKLQRKEDKTLKDKQAMDKLIRWNDEELRRKGINIC